MSNDGYSTRSRESETGVRRGLWMWGGDEECGSGLRVVDPVSYLTSELKESRYRDRGPDDEWLQTGGHIPRPPVTPIPRDCF